MSTKIIQKSVKFFSELVNGSDFTLNTSQFTEALSDSATGKCKSQITVDIFVGMDMANFQILYANSGTPGPTNPDYKIVKRDAKFLSEGITIGSRIGLTYDPDVANSNVLNCYFIVTSLTDTVLNVTYDGAGTGNNDVTLATLYADVNSQSNASNPFSYTNPGYLAIEPNFNGLEFAYNLVENSVSGTSMTSSLTSTTNVIKVKGVETTTGQPAVNGYATSNNKAWVMSPVADPIVTVELSAKVWNDNALLQLAFGNRYIITHEFTVPYYHDGEDNSLLDSTDPPTDYLGLSSPKYIYQTTWFTDINNPNTGSTTVYNTSKGSSGYFDEAFNGEANPYTISNLVYFDLTNNASTTKISIGERTRVTFDVDNTSSDFTATQTAVIAHGAIIDSSDYTNSKEIFDDVWTFETLRNFATNGLVAGTLITDYEITQNSVSSITVTFIVEFTNPQNTVLEEDQYYILALQLRNDSESVVLDSHKVHLLVDYNQYGKNNDISGLFGVTRFEQIPHPTTLETIPLDTIGFTNAEYNIEEGALALVEFWLDTDKGAVLDDLKFQIGGYDTGTENISVLRETTIDLSSGVLVGTSWNFNLNSTIGYPLKAGDQFNVKSLTTGTIVGNKQFYTLLVAYRIPWQDWLKFKNAPTSFYDINEPQNGLNQKASRYSDVGTNQIRLFVDAKVSQNGIPTDYVTASQNINCYDYDEDNLPLPVTYIATIETLDINDVSLEKNIIDNVYTKIRATFTPDTLPTFSTSVDFNDVDTIWNRFAFGNLCSIQSRTGVWLNQTANNTGDEFVGTLAVPAYNKESVLYLSTTTSITALDNCGAFHGCYSVDLYETFTCTGTMYADPSFDDDALIFTIALFVDTLTGEENTISFVASPGGVSMDINPVYSPGDVTNDIFLIGGPKVPRVAIIYNFGRNDWQVLDVATTTGPLRWDQAPLDFDINRDGSDITVNVDWDLNGTPFSTTLTADLNLNANTQKFLGPQPIGFGFLSQASGGFKDVELALPGADFWGAVRIEPEGSGSDNGLFELSTDIEGDSNNLLRQPDNSNPLILSELGLTATSLVVTAQVNTLLINSGQTYKISAEIGENEVGDLDLLTTFAWVDNTDRKKLYVKFNTSVDIATATNTGITLSGGPLTITGYNIAGSTKDYLLFDLSNDMAVGSGYTLNYDATNTIESLNNSLTLGLGSIIIYDL